MNSKTLKIIKRELEDQRQKLRFFIMKGLKINTEPIKKRIIRIDEVIKEVEIEKYKGEMKDGK